MDLLTPFRVSTLFDTYESSSDDISQTPHFILTNYHACHKGGSKPVPSRCWINFVMPVYYSYDINVKY